MSEGDLPKRPVSADIVPIGIMIVLALSPLLVFLAIMVVPMIGACTTEVKRQIHLPSGVNFEISETDCDLLAKDVGMSVLASEKGDWRQTLLFKFTPIDETELPDIKVDAQHATILISIDAIGDVFSHLDHWRGMAIKYDIGHIYYPSPNDPAGAIVPARKESGDR